MNDFTRQWRQAIAAQHRAARRRGRKPAQGIKPGMIRKPAPESERPATKDGPDSQQER